MKDISCLIGITMLIGSLSMTIMKKDTTIFRKFNDLLNKEQKMIYEEIVRERLMIYFTGRVVGLGLGIYYYVGSKDKYKLCKFLAIIYLMKLGFYYFYPKKPLMLYSLTEMLCPVMKVLHLSKESLPFVSMFCVCHENVVFVSRLGA